MKRDRWTKERAADWQAQVGWRVGCNFIPSTAGNQLEMWQEETFDISTINKELGWAADIGINTIRLYLHDLLFGDSPEGFLNRLETVVATADSHGIGVVPVLFDGVWHPRPQLGTQPVPTPRLHNSVWVQSPGSEIFYDESQWPDLRPYVHGVLSAYKDDRRIVAWDLFNEPDQRDFITLQAGSREHKIAQSTKLVATVFEWARQVESMQPLTVGLWEFGPDAQPASNTLNALILESSDIVSFHCYEPHDKLVSVIGALATHGRPLLCTEWLARSEGSTADLLEVFADLNVGAIHWGLVDGKTQTRFPWRSWTEAMTDDEPWFHELLHADGRPYDPQEIEIFRNVTARHR